MILQICELNTEEWLDYEITYNKCLLDYLTLRLKINYPEFETRII